MIRFRPIFLVSGLILFGTIHADDPPSASTPAHPRELHLCDVDGSDLGCTIAHGISTIADRFPSSSRLVSIKAFGAIGDNVHDDTIAIQTAIDYAYNHNIQGIFCPSGFYKTSGTIYLDPPGNLRSNFLAPSNFSFSLAFVGQDEGLGNHQRSGCQLRPSFNNAAAFIVGPGQGMTVRGIAIIGPNTGASTYRGNLPKNGIGLGVAGGNGGASHTLIENVDVENFYTLYETGANGACCLADSNTWRKIDGNNGHYGIYFSSGENDINDLVEPRLGATIAIWSGLSRQVTVFGGNLSAVFGQSNAFAISGISNFSKLPEGNGFDYTFTGVIISPDAYIPKVYNSFTIVTAHFGVVPLTMIDWDPETNIATFQVYPNWAFGNFGVADLTSATDLESEIAAASTIYATERVTTALGLGISLEGVHVENPSACQTLYWAGAGYSGATRSSVKNPFYNSDPARPDLAPSHNPTTAQLAQFYCQQMFPFIEQASNGSSAHLDLDGGDFGQLGIPTAAPLLIEQGPYRFLSARNLGLLKPLNMRIADDGGHAFGEQGGLNQLETTANGAGEWDGWYFPPYAMVGGFSAGAQYILHGHLTTPFYGYRPAPGQEPNLSPDIYALVSGALGALGSYPPIDCETVYRSVGWKSGALTHIHLRSASCPGYSWGQNLTAALVGEPITWSYKGGSAMLYLDAKTLSWMFPGLGFTLPGSSNDDPYVVSGVYPQLGYVTVMNVATYSGAPLAGNKTTIYSCSANCSIGQAPYSWTEY